MAVVKTTQKAYHYPVTSPLMSTIREGAEGVTRSAQRLSWPLDPRRLLAYQEQPDAEENMLAAPFTPSFPAQRHCIINAEVEIPISGCTPAKEIKEKYDHPQCGIILDWTGLKQYIRLQNPQRLNVAIKLRSRRCKRERQRSPPLSCSCPVMMTDDTFDSAVWCVASGGCLVEDLGRVRGRTGGRGEPNSFVFSVSANEEKNIFKKKRDACW